MKRIVIDPITDSGEILEVPVPARASVPMKATLTLPRKATAAVAMKATPVVLGRRAVPAIR
jgi:hypothetical protein